MLKHCPAKFIRVGPCCDRALIDKALGKKCMVTMPNATPESDLDWLFRENMSRAPIRHAVRQIKYALGGCAILH